MIRKIFLKIREQLEDPTHPIIWIIREFQEAFKHDIETKIADIKRAAQSRDPTFNFDLSHEDDTAQQYQLLSNMLKLSGKTK